jgi:hypothetical protein
MVIIMEKIIINGKEREYVVFELSSLKLDKIKRRPSFEDIMEDDDVAFEQFNDASNSNYICDYISEIANDMCDCSKVWDNAKYMQEYIEEAVAQGLVDTSKFDLDRAFIAGAYEYYTQALYDNLDELACNYILNYLDGTEICVAYVGEEEFDIEDENLMEDIISRLDYKLDDVSNVDNDDRFWDLEEQAMQILDEIFEEMLDEEDGLIIAIEDNFEEVLQDWIDENLDENEEPEFGSDEWYEMEMTDAPTEEDEENEE